MPPVKPPNRSPPMPMPRNIWSMWANGSPPKKLSKKEEPRPPPYPGGRWLRPSLMCPAQKRRRRRRRQVGLGPGEALERTANAKLSLSAMGSNPRKRGRRVRDAVGQVEATHRSKAGVRPLRAFRLLRCL